MTITFTAYPGEETVSYTSHAQPSHPLPEGAQLLRSFTLASLSAGSQPQQAGAYLSGLPRPYTSLMELCGLPTAIASSLILEISGKSTRLLPMTGRAR